MTQPIHQEKAELERSLTLQGAMAIGIGTMVGAGIFIFPGIAAGRAGVASTVSFFLGAVIAILVALPTSEMSTAMPESGGMYYFIYRAMGSTTGFLVGFCLWLGLVFASAFYLVGFGYYLQQVFVEAGFEVNFPVRYTALGATFFLTAINLVGTQKVSHFQNWIVGILLTILTVFLGYGIASALGFIGKASQPEVFAPHGYTAILTTTALIFTAYLGFAQIANVAGEIKDPQRNLPLAMVGSVLIVGAFYIITMYVSSSFFGSEKLSRLGETALIELARELIGNLGAIAIIATGVLATLSSGNASILSSSRSVYALGRDGFLPEWVSQINERFLTPHLAILAAGIPISTLVFLNQVEVLAEVASFLHLVVYGLLCLALIFLRRQNPDWYKPTFKSPGTPYLPLMGGVCCFALIGFMQTLSIYIGLGVIFFAFLWYILFARREKLAREAAEKKTEEEQRKDREKKREDPSEEEDREKEDSPPSE